jgi:glycosyltransferase involved in cell wall biosynthesis
MVSFYGRFRAGLQAAGYQVVSSLEDHALNAVLVIGGSRDLVGLWRASRRGARIVQRLNGMNWMHRQRWMGLRHALRAEAGNWILRFIRSRLADQVIYQSEFAKAWWERASGPTRVPASVVYNAVDLQVYRPETGSDGGMSPRPGDRYRVLVVEGSLMGGYELGLASAVDLVERLNVAHRHNLGKPVELVVAGQVSPQVQAHWSQKSVGEITWMGLVDQEGVIELDRGAHLLYSADLNAACPNAVIEALACGLPVLAFGSGALPEMVTGEAGTVVPYGGDPWHLDPPDVDALAAGAVNILQHQERYRVGARARAEAAFGLERMLAGYLEALVPGTYVPGN